jgi:hypothetical protein
MGYEMYRLLNYASDSTVETPRRKPKKMAKAKNDTDDESSNDSDAGWQKKSTKAKVDLALIERYRSSE